MSSIGPDNQNSSQAAVARKRRIAMRNKQRTFSNGTSFSSEDKSLKRSLSGPIADSSGSSNCVEEVAIDAGIEQPKCKKPHITGIKEGFRYDPGVKLSKDELKAWRKEARRVRNRESAAASRKKNRESIHKLESEVADMKRMHDEMKKKYDSALKYIIDLEDKQRENYRGSPPSAIILNDLEVCRRKEKPKSFVDQEVTQSNMFPSVAEETTELQSLVSSLPSPTPESIPDVVHQHDTNLKPFLLCDNASSDSYINMRNFALSDASHYRSPFNTSQPKHVINTISRPIACV